MISYVQKLEAQKWVMLTLLTLIVILSSCKTKKVETESKEKVKIEYVTNTEYRDTGKIVTHTEIEYRTIYDTITKTFIQVKYKERIAKTENKAITEQKKDNGVITQKKKESVKEVTKTGNSWYYNLLFILFIIILAYLAFKRFFK